MPYIFHYIASETNGPTKLPSTGEVMENSIKNIISPELKACYPTTCLNILKLAYSPHNTLIATGVSSSSAPIGTISGLATISGNIMAPNKSLPNVSVPITAAVNSSQSQIMSAGFTKIFINGTGNGCVK